MDHFTLKRKKNKSQYKPKNYFALPHSLLDHPEFLAMNWASQALLIHMCRLYNGFNNGDISIALSDMEKKGWSKGTLDRSKKELIKMDWIKITRQGYKKVCSLYALTWIPLDSNSKYDSVISNYSIRDLKA